MTAVIRPGQWAGLSGPAALSRGQASEPWEVVTERIASQLAESGFDIACPIRLGWYNGASSTAGSSVVPRGAAGEAALAILVGNTKKLWPRFLRACASDDDLLQHEDPLDLYTERCIDAVAQPRGAVRVLYAHDSQPDTQGSSYVGMQRLAEVAGLAYTHDFSHLSLHPRYGPWFALRALIVFDQVEMDGPRPSPLPNPLDLTTAAYVRVAVRSARTSSSVDHEEHEQTDSAANEAAEAEAMHSSWRKWVAVRDAPCPGHNWRYSACQMEYHYTHSRQVLRTAVRRHASQLRASGEFVRRSLSRSMSGSD